MDFAEVARSYPQFGKSTWNLRRTREEVFSTKKVEFKRSNGAGCCGGAEADSPNWSSCGCDGGQRRSRAVVPHDIFDDPWGGGNDRPWAGGRKPVLDAGAPSNCMPGAECCVDVYCYPVPDHEFFLHCYFHITDCSGVTWRLELDPNQAKAAYESNKSLKSPVDMIVVHKDAPFGQNDKFEVGECEPCPMCFPGDHSCPAAECLFREAADYPLGEALPEDFPTEKEAKRGATPQDWAFALGGPHVPYKVYGPNSNTFVAYLARRCGLPALKTHRVGRDSAPGADLAHDDRVFSRYLELREGWLMFR